MQHIMLLYTEPQVFSIYIYIYIYIHTHPEPQDAYTTCITYLGFLEGFFSSAATAMGGELVVC